MARKRLTGLKRRFQRNPEVHQKYTDQKTKLLQITASGTFHTMESSASENRTSCALYLTVQCAVQHRGVPLNQVLMQGPDFNNWLDAVLLRFRKQSIALVADVEAMFYQVLVSPRDRDSLRFLWWRDGDFTKEAIPHRMKVHVFGATSSPSCAAFRLHQAELEFGHIYEPLVTPTVEGALEQRMWTIAWRLFPTSKQSCLSQCKRTRSIPTCTRELSE